MRLRSLFLPLAGCLLFVACEDSENGGGLDAGDAGDTSFDAAKPDVSTSDAAQPSDAATDGDAASAPVCRLDQADADAAAGGLTTQWGTLGSDAGTVTVLGQLVAADCTFTLAHGIVGGAAAPPAYPVFLEKKDTTVGSCPGAKGVRSLFTSYAVPHGFLAYHPLAPHLFVIAYDHKNTLSGSSPVQMSMEQVDWDTGDTVHSAIFAVEGSSQQIPPTGTVSALTTSGCDVVLEGNATFPGASGTDTGKGFRATYTHFLAPVQQSASTASSATYK